MAVAVRSVGATASGTGVSAVITKPVGLASGDLMVAFVYTRSTSVTGTTAPTGWTEIGTWAFITDTGMAAWWKIADSTDAAATNFTFPFTGGASSNSADGHMLAITGHDATTPINVQNQSAASGTVVTVTGITPSIANSLLLFAFAVGSSTASITAVQTANNNPTWTSQWNATVNANSKVAGFTGTYTVTTTTGNATSNALGVTTNCAAKLVAIAPSGGAYVSNPKFFPNLRKRLGG